MSKMSSEFIRQAESRSLDNAEEVRELRAEVARLEAEKAELHAACELALRDIVRYQLLNRLPGDRYSGAAEASLRSMVVRYMPPERARKELQAFHDRD